MTKNGNKVGTIYKVLTLLCISAFKIVQTLLTFFVEFWKYFFFDIPCYPLPIAVRNSLTNQFYRKNLRFCVFAKKKRVQNWNVEKGPGITCHFFFLFLKIYRNIIHLIKLIFQWILDSDGQGIARDIKKKSFLKRDKKC